VVEPNERNGRRSACRLIADKITTVPKAKLGAQIGRLDDEDMVRLNQVMTVFLGMAVTPRGGRGRHNGRSREVADKEVRIMGSKSELLRTLVAASGGKSAFSLLY